MRRQVTKSRKQTHDFFAIRKAERLLSKAHRAERKGRVDRVEGTLKQFGQVLETIG